MTFLIVKLPKVYVSLLFNLYIMIIDLFSGKILEIMVIIG